MSAPSSIDQRMLEQAKKLLQAKKYSPACEWFEKYFNRVYKEGTEITPDFATSLLHYAEALINKAEEDGKPGKYNEDDLETATEYLLTARETYQNADKSLYSIGNLVDTHIFLGRICIMNNQFKRAQNEFTKAVQILKEDSRSTWRLLVSTMIYLGSSYELRERPKEGLKVFQEVLTILEDTFNKEETTEEDKKDIPAFKEDIQNRIKQLEDDIKEQEANKEDLKEEEEEEEEEEDNNEEEEEEDNNDEEDGEEEDAKNEEAPKEEKETTPEIKEPLLNDSKPEPLADAAAEKALDQADDNK